jgi:hypothetical protein
MVQEASLKIYARGVVLSRKCHILIFPRAACARTLKIRQTNSATLKVPDGSWIRLGTYSCCETVPMELPVPNGSMHHRESKSEIDDTRHILQGTSCTIAARNTPPAGAARS